MDSNLFWCIIGIVGGAIASFLISYIFYFKGLTKKRISYDIKTSPIFSNIKKIKGLEIKYNSIEIENLYFSEITIKNIGNSIIKKEDLVPSCPISVLTNKQFSKNNIERIEYNSVCINANYEFSINQENNCIKLDFDYIPKKAIIKFSLVHIGDIYFNGDLFDGEIISSKKNNHTKNYFINN